MSKKQKVIYSGGGWMKENGRMGNFMVKELTLGMI